MRRALLGLVALLPSFVAAVTPLPPARFLSIGPAWADSSINVVANRRHAAFTHGRSQFAAYYDGERFMVLAHRRLGEDGWETSRTQYRGNVADAHNAISLAVDGDGFVHVAWDHHGQRLNYARGIKPLSLQLGPKTRMTGRAERQVTYPEFHVLPDGDLLCFYRDGASGRGRLVLNRYDTHEQRWETVHANLLDGEAEHSAYWSAAVDRKGGLHLAWNWRDSADVATNHDIAYAFSADGGKTWSTIERQALSVPMTVASVAYVVRIPTNRNLMNSPWIAVDLQGRPYVTSYWSAQPNDAPQFHLVRHDGAQWRVEQITSRGEPFTLAGTATKRPPISRGVLLVQGWEKEPPAHLVYRDDARDGRAIVLSTPRIGSGQWTERALTTNSLGGWEPVIDPVQWDRMQQFHLLMQPVTQRDGDDQRTLATAPSTIGMLVVSPRELQIAGAPRATISSQPSDGKPDSDTAAEIIRDMRRVADWQLAHPPKDEPRSWNVAPLYIGLLALHRASGDARYRDAVLAQAEANRWQPGERVYHADDHAVMQAYLELYRHARDERMLAPSRARLDEILARPSTASLSWNAPGSQERWNWCDALFMSPASWLMMWQATGERRYLDFMNREWWATTDSLHSPATGWFFRDESFLDQREPNGRTVHWSRGNGWVVAGLARVLDLLPRDHADYPRYEALYKQMMQAALTAQQPDGMWRAGLLDPTAHPAREATGTSFMTFALAWGVNRGVLSREQAESAVRRAWRALTHSIRADGKLADCQPVGDAPLGFDSEHTEPFGVGAFLLAGSEVHRLVAGAPADVSRLTD